LGANIPSPYSQMLGSTSGRLDFDRTMRCQRGRETLVNLLMTLRHLSPQGLRNRTRSSCPSNRRRKNWALPHRDQRGMSCLSNRSSRLLRSQHFGCDSFHLETHQRNRHQPTSCHLSVDTALCRPIGRTCSTRCLVISTVSNSISFEVNIRSRRRGCEDVVVFNGIIPKASTRCRYSCFLAYP
jgi:hypothetical protein